MNDWNDCPFLKTKAVDDNNQSPRRFQKPSEKNEFRIPTIQRNRANDGADCKHNDDTRIHPKNILSAALERKRKFSPRKVPAGIEHAGRQTR